MRDDVWVEVDLGALRHNLGQVRARLADGTRILAVVKANGFGHGYVEPSRALVQAGAWGLGVSRLEEALTLRSGGIEAPILVFAPILAENAPDAVDAAVDITVDSRRLAQAVSDAASHRGVRARVHVKVDTGMGRIGVAPDEAPSLCRAVTAMPGLELAGLYTHFADAAAVSLSRTREQLRRFLAVCEDVHAQGIEYGIAHAANSAALVRLPESHLDMVRPGTVLYGQYPSAAVPRVLDLHPTWTLKARVCSVRMLASGARVGYGGEYRTKRDSRIAVLPIGYADGYTLVPEGPMYRQRPLAFAVRRLRGRREVRIRGRSAPVLGRVSMQTCVVDVTDIPGVEPGDEAVVPAMRIPTSPLIRRIYADSSS